MPAKSNDESFNWQSDIDFAGVEFLGERQNQEDYSLFRVYNQKLGLLIALSDGMGGHTSGEIASKLATNSFDSTFNSYPSESISAKLTAALHQANGDIAKKIKLEPSLNGMGCTLVGAYIDRDGINWISVGDSLLYLFRGKKLIRLNADHSMGSLVDESYRLGKISKQEAENYPNRNALRSAVMGEDLPLIDSPKNPTKLFSGDIVLVASDGLQTIDERTIESIVDKSSSSSALKIASRLLDQVKAQKRPKQDNTTIQVIKIPSAFPSPPIKINKYWIFPPVLLSLLLVGGYFYEDVMLGVAQLLGKKEQKAVVIEPTAVPVPVTPQPELSKPSEIPQAVNAVPEAPSKNQDSKATKKKSEEKSKGAKPSDVSPKPKPSQDLKGMDGGLGQELSPQPVKKEGAPVEPAKEESSSTAQGVKT